MTKEKPGFGIGNPHELPFSQRCFKAVTAINLSQRKIVERSAARKRSIGGLVRRVFYLEEVKCYLDSNHWFLCLFQLVDF